ncbi:hypothetical protein PBRA_002619 [Plasmodiophora brassicae]|nr:hypothetical protein PBRA_002619 [Plasmodiophora brassicae]
MDSPTSPTTARLEHMFELLNILDASDDTLIRRLEAELLRTDAEQMRQDAREDERDIDAAIDRDLLQSMSDTDPTRRTDLQNLLLAFSGRLNADDLSRSVQSPERGAHQDDVGQIDDDEEEDDGDDDLGGDDEDDAHFHQLLLPNGSSLTTTHVDIISNALRNATTALNLDVADVHAGGQRRSRSRSRHRREEMGTQTTDERDERRESNASDPYDRERDGEREQIEGYEGDRIERVEADQRQHASVGQEQGGDEDARVAVIMETLRAFHASGLGAEELDDFVLQTVLNLHGGPSRDAGPNATGDPIGDDQMRLYQECIAVIDDFLDIQAMITDENDEDDVPNVVDDEDDDALDGGARSAG